MRDYVAATQQHPFSIFRLYVMVTRKLENEFEELKSYFNTKLSKTRTNYLLNDLRKEISKDIQNEAIKGVSI